MAAPVAVIAGAAGATLIAGPAGATSASSGYRAFARPTPATIRGYTGDAMEPFIAAGGRYLLFNNLNRAPAHTTIRYATAVSRQTFRYRGVIRGANDPVALTGVPSMAGRTLYFISPRSYPRTLSTVYAGDFAGGSLTHVHLVPGISADRPGIVDFDVEAQAGGATLYVSEGQFSPGGVLERSQLVSFDRRGASFARDPNSARLLGVVNGAAVLTYAASVSRDGRELFFTRLSRLGDIPAIYRAVRSRAGLPFGQIQRVAAITGFAEAPSLSAGGRVLYYHRKVGRHFAIYFVIRP